MKTKLLILCLLTTQSIFSQSIWHQTNGPAGKTDISSIAINRLGTIFLGASDNQTLFGEKGLYRSKNNGINWEKIFEEGISRILRDINDDIYIVSSSGELFRSTNSGENWQRIYDVYQQVRTITLDKNGTIYAAVNGKIFTSSNHGVQWNTINISWDPTIIGVNNNGDIYLGINDWGRFYKSTDGGVSWTQVGLSYVEAITFDDSSNIYASTSSSLELKYSNNEGNSWNSIGLSGLLIPSIVIDTNNVLFAATKSAGIKYSINNGSTWNDIPTNDQEINQIVHTPQNKLLACSNNGGVYQFDLNTIIRIGLTNSSVIAMVNSDSSVIAASGISGVFKTTDKGKTWIDLNFPSQDGIYDMKINANNEIYVCGYNGLYCYNDSTQSWIKLYSDYVSTFVFYSQNQFIIGTGQGVRMLILENGGSSSYSLGMRGKYIESLFFFLGTHIFAGTLDQGLYYSTEPYTQWNLIGIENQTIYNIEAESSESAYICSSIGLFDYNITSQALTDLTSSLNQMSVFDYLKKDNDQYLATAGGLYINKSNNIWLKDSTETELNLTYCLLADLSGNIFAGVKNAGVFIKEAASIKDEDLDFILTQNYPNPFNTNTTIQYSLSNQHFVQIKIYDILGREVSTIVNEEKPAGKYNVNFNAKTLASGVYFYQIKAGSFVQTKKLMLLK